MIGIVLQARMGSSRLPGKVLKKIGPKNLLEHICYRLSFLKHPGTMVLATTVNPADDVIEAFCKEINIECFRGSEENVLERYYLCAQKYGFMHIVRLTGDNPFVDIDELDRLIIQHLEEHSDYSHSLTNLPYGVGVEIFTFEALERSHKNASNENHREHVNEYIQENPDMFKISILSVPAGKNRPDVRLTIDTEEDYRKSCFIVEKCENSYITTEEAIEKCLQFV